MVLEETGCIEVVLYGGKWVEDAIEEQEPKHRASSKRLKTSRTSSGSSRFQQAVAERKKTEATVLESKASSSVPHRVALGKAIPFWRPPPPPATSSPSSSSSRSNSLKTTTTASPSASRSKSKRKIPEWERDEKDIEETFYYLDPSKDRSPSYRFKFFYRSKAFLQAQDILGGASLPPFDSRSGKDDADVRWDFFVLS